MLNTALLAACGPLLAAAGFVPVRLFGGERERIRRYGGGGRRLRLRWPVRCKTPGLPRDGVIPGAEEAVIAAIEHAEKRRGR